MDSERTESSAARHTVIIGGGLAGLTAAYSLARLGRRVTLFEAERSFGGLGSTVMLEGQPVERFYHFICRRDEHLIQLAQELGVAPRLHWRRTRTSFYHNGRLYPFGTPFDLLRFDAIPWIQRIRFGLHVISSRYRREWRRLDGIPARIWLADNIGEQAYHVIWEPLLRVKFGSHHERISAAWIWHRIWRVARSRSTLLSPEMFGHFDQGSEVITNALTDWLRVRSEQVTLRPGTRVDAIHAGDGRVCAVTVGGERMECEAVISTVALPALAALLPAQANDLAESLRRIDYIGVVCMVMSLRQPFSPYFWMNINDPRIPFNGVIELTNLNRTYQQQGLHLLYVPLYLGMSELRYSLDDGALFEEYMQALQVVNPSFDKNWVREWKVFREPHAQAICTTGFAGMVPPMRSSLPGLYLTDSTQFYPEDRTLSAAIRLGRQVTAAVLEDLS